MAPLTAPAVAELPPEQAAVMARVLNLQAAWENHRSDSAPGDAHGPGLRERQRRYDAFRTAQAGLGARNRRFDLPEAGSLGSPERLAVWCRAVAAVCRRAGADAEAPTQVVVKASRIAARIAARLSVAPAGRDGCAEGMAGAIADLDAVAAWCDGLGGSQTVRAEPAAAGTPDPATVRAPDPAPSGWRAA